jgi:lipoprotein-anchoring transpeptidase ErfK/SrfK
MSALRILTLSYLASASVFVVAATLVAHPQMSREIAAVAGGFTRMIDESFRQPDYVSPVVRLTLSPPDAGRAVQSRIVPPPPRTVQAPDLGNPDFSASATIAILPDLSPESAPVPPEPKFAKPQVPQIPDFRIARDDADKSAKPAFRIPEPPPLTGAPFSDRATAVAMRLKTVLTPEMRQNFDLVLYVSKANRGPLAQRMYVLQKQSSGEFRLAYDWAASTGREQDEISPRGKSSFTATPKGYYELDPERMYRRYHSFNWDQDMPHAMFFNWERQGLETGLAIHAAAGDDVAKLGSRASAGCVHLAPENAALLYDLIRADYRGAVPRFAYNDDTETMSNTGDFMHRRDGSLKMMDGYRVLVVIEDYGGDNVMAALD